MKKIILICLIAALAFNVNAQTGPGGVGSNDGASNLKLWLRTDKNLQYNSLKDITEWVDYSGYDFTFTNSTVSPRFLSNTINGLPVVNFFSDEASLEALNVTGSSLFSAQNNTVIFVKNSTSGTYWFYWQGDASNEVSYRLSSNKSVFNFNTTDLTSTTDINGAYHILSNQTNGTNQLFYLNGAADGTQANGSSLNTGLSSDLYFGSYDGTSTNGWTGFIAEGIIFDRIINSAERILVENYSRLYTLPTKSIKYSQKFPAPHQ